MRLWAGDIIDTIQSASETTKFRGIKICRVKSVNPRIFTYNDVDMGTTFGDIVYIHPLFLSEPIEYDENLLSQIQNFNQTTAYNSPNFQGVIEGSIPEFIKNFYLFYKAKESIYLIKEGDLLAIYELGENSYLVLQKVLIDEIKEDKGKERRKK